MVVLVPDPVVIVPPGVLVNVHVPVAGKPLNITLPVGRVQVGCVIVPTAGAVGTGAEPVSSTTAVPPMLKTAGLLGTTLVMTTVAPFEHNL
jgi:hypothetical protein